MDSVPKPAPLHKAIAAGLSELGMPDLACRSTTYLVRDGDCVGQRFLFDEVQAVWLIAQNVVQFQDDEGRILKSVQVESARRQDAA